MVININNLHFARKSNPLSPVVRTISFLPELFFIAGLIFLFYAQKAFMSDSFLGNNTHNYSIPSSMIRLHENQGWNFCIKNLIYPPFLVSYSRAVIVVIIYF